MVNLIEFVSTYFARYMFVNNGFFSIVKVLWLKYIVMFM